MCMMIETNSRKQEAQIKKIEENRREYVKNDASYHEHVDKAENWVSGYLAVRKNVD